MVTGAVMYYTLGQLPIGRTTVLSVTAAGMSCYGPHWLPPPNDQTSGGHDPIVCTKHGGSQPTGSMDPMVLNVLLLHSYRLASKFNSRKWTGTRESLPYRTQ